MEISDISRRSGGTFGIKANDAGWGTRGIVEQANECGGDCRTSCGGKGLVQALMPLKATSDFLDGVGHERTSSSGVELAEESSS